MLRQRFSIAVLGWLACVHSASAQIPQVLYTWNGTGDTRDGTIPKQPTRLCSPTVSRAN